MKLLSKKSQPQKEVSERKPEVSSLADRIEQAKAEAVAYVESKVQELKASPEGATLPIDWLRDNIYRMARAGYCDCKCALSLLEKETGNGS